MAKKKENDNVKEEKKEVKETKKVEHTTGHKAEVTNEPKRKSSKYKKLIERYKRRNRIVEVVIACIILVIAFVIACNPTFLKTNFTKKVENSTVSIDIPRFTYYVDSDDNTIVFKTLRKSANTKAFFQSFLESERFDVYYCSGSDTPYYYNSVGKYFIYNIEVKKTFAIKTITVNYTTTSYNEFCSTIEVNEEL